jgi:hypothetical protein
MSFGLETAADKSVQRNLQRDVSAVSDLNHMRPTFPRKRAARELHAYTPPGSTDIWKSGVRGEFRVR